MRTQEVNEVIRVLDNYIHGTREGDGDTLRRIFHSDAMVAGWFGSDLILRKPDGFIARVENSAAGSAYTASVVSVNVIGNTATATVLEDGLWDGWSFVNQFHLIRDAAGGWIITAKLFHRD